MNNDLISRSALKEDFKSRLADCNEWIEKAKDKETKIRASAVKAFIGEVIMTINNAPTVAVDCKDCDGYEAGYSAGLKDAERPQGEWIPVSERLPDKNMPCLVSVGKLNLTKIAMYSDLMETINHKIFWQGDYGKNNFQNITEYVNAWQSLPEPYKKGGKE